MNRSILLIVVIQAILLSSCEKDEEVKPLPDDRYPYTYYALNQREWSQLNTEFTNVNTHDSLYLNEYGFVQGKLFLEEGAEINADLVVAQTENLLKTYSNFMGIKNESAINVAEDLIAIDYMLAPIGHTNVYEFFERVFPDYIALREMYGEVFDYEYEPEPFSHYFFIPQAQLNKSDLTSTRIDLFFHELDTSVEVLGNWFPEAFIPSEQIYTKEEAIDIASDAFKDEVDENIWNEEQEHFPTQTQLTLLPVKFEDKVEIREIWDITAYGNDFWMYYNIYIDTQTGEILRKRSDVIPH
jgi:hypothetical protein